MKFIYYLVIGLLSAQTDVSGSYTQTSSSTASAPLEPKDSNKLAPNNQLNLGLSIGIGGLAGIPLGLTLGKIINTAEKAHPKQLISEQERSPAETEQQKRLLAETEQQKRLLVQEYLETRIKTIKLHHPDLESKIKQFETLLDKKAQSPNAAPGEPLLTAEEGEKLNTLRSQHPIIKELETYKLALNTLERSTPSYLHDAIQANWAQAIDKIHASTAHTPEQKYHAFQKLTAEAKTTFPMDNTMIYNGMSKFVYQSELPPSLLSHYSQNTADHAHLHELLKLYYSKAQTPEAEQYRYELVKSHATTRIPELKQQLENPPGNQKDLFEKLHGAYNDFVQNSTFENLSQNPDHKKFVESLLHDVRAKKIKDLIGHKTTIHPAVIAHLTTLPNFPKASK
jgi:hypothetical protein